MDGLIDEARAFDPALASSLARFADNFDYGGIAALTSGAAEREAQAPEKDPGAGSDA
ncbi:MAG: hypothetical protein CAPSK01_000516 [Candidatus Accumulibacter vicinus]|uniref:Uncharacterized protein n=1 Tax=Candidatus Accumulibacter vicinus TaxID=2954382 RepID=A0A084Y509_9PROT|nr:MAG: hypothetical protein CAPSK01_000516 [Candidatus Accumulibacter vicinus]